MANLPSARKRVLSGMRSTGKLHLGNYVGALQNWVRMQDQYECFFFVADWHALTTDYADTSQVKQNSIEVLLDWLAAGLDPERCTMFIQSHVPQHAELHLLFSMITPLGWLERVPTYKEQRENITEKDLGTYGFLGYPVLQAADILIYKGDFVPVGEDQVPHVELTREIARRFNGFYPAVGGEFLRRPQTTGAFTWTKDVFPEPQPLLTPAAKLPGTDGRKMSKSYGNTILLTDPEPAVREKLRGMVNDPARARRSDPGNPDVCPVADLHKVFSEPGVVTKMDVGCRTAGISCVECKSWAADAIVRTLRPMQEKRRFYEQDLSRAWKVLESGSARAREVASKTMGDVRMAMGMSWELPISMPMRPSEGAGEKLTLDPSVWSIASKVERGDAIRSRWMTSLPTEIVLKDIGSRTFLTNRGKRVGIPTSREIHPGEWFFAPRDRHYDVLVLLCVTSSLEIVDLVLPQKILQPNWKKLQRREDGRVALLVRQTKDDFLLAIPHEHSVPISEFRSNRKALY